MTPSLSRRQALGILGATAATAAAAVWWSVDDDGAAPPATTAPPVALGPIVDPSSLDAGLRAVGGAYLALHPEEGDAAQLRTALGVDATTPATSLLTAQADQIAADHADGTTVDVDGWVLARTEARIAALHVRS